MMKKIRKQTKIWITRDERRMRVCDMSDSHLHNTIKIIVRLFKAELREQHTQLLSYLSMGPAWGAEMCAERELLQIEDLIFEAFNEDLSVEQHKSLPACEYIRRTEVLEAQKKHPILHSMVLEVKRRKAIIDIRKEK